ncbi:MAG TPA: GNAT family N-acetyltransferase [Terrimicrobiaceae bacterium]|nr:GNAT family N-acetyltransferase [Terrimicrobiaceae bacterium]
MEIGTSPVVHNKSKSRFEVEVGGQFAVAEYRLDGQRMIFTHTEVPPRFRGHGIAEKLVLAGFKVAQGEGLEIVAHCSYVARVLQKHPEFRA